MSEEPFGKCPECAFRCELCEEKTLETGGLHRHHTSYLFDMTMLVCRSCHLKIHNVDGFCDDLRPALSRSRAEDLGLVQPL